jgi:hypothetical protein
MSWLPKLMIFARFDIYYRKRQIFGKWEMNELVTELPLALYVIIPIGVLINAIWSQTTLLAKKLNRGVKYNDAESGFLSDYDRENPETKEEAQLSWEERRRETMGDDEFGNSDED